MSMLDELEAEVSGDRPSFLTKNPKMSLDDIEAEVTAKPDESRKIKNTGPIEDVRADFKRATAENAKPGPWESALMGAGRGASFGFSDEIEGGINRGFDALSGRESGPSYAQYRDAARARGNAAHQAHPIASTAGEFAGGLATAPVTGPAGAGWRAVATSAAKQGAAYGLGNSEADLTKGDVIGAARDTAFGSGLGAATGGIIGKVVRGAPERVDQRVIKSINLGDDTNSKLSTARKVMARAGEEGADLLEILEGNSPLKKVLGTKAASNPRAAEKFVGKRLDHLTGQTDPLYQQIGDVDISILDGKLAKAGAGFVAEGKAAMAGVMERARANLAKLYGSETDSGKTILSGTTLPARSVRNYANEVGEVAFAGEGQSMTPKVRARAQQHLYREITDAIAEAGEKAGADVAKLKGLNKEISTLIPIKQALTERAVQKEAGRSSLGENLRRVAIPAAASALGGAGGGVPGGLTGAATGAAAYGLAKASKPLARAADWQLARLVNAARKGSTSAQLGQLAIEMGLSRVVGEELADQFRGPRVSE